MKNEIKVFDNQELEIKVRVIENEDQSISINAEDTAIGFGWTQEQMKNGKQYTSMRWERMNEFSAQCGFPHMWGKDDYIPEELPANGVFRWLVERKKVCRFNQGRFPFVDLEGSNFLLACPKDVRQMIMSLVFSLISAIKALCNSRVILVIRLISFVVSAKSRPA